MRALLASLLVALALLWASASGGRASQPLPHFPPQALSPAQPSDQTPSLAPSGEYARSLLTTGQKARRGAGFAPTPFILPEPPQLAVASAQLLQRLGIACAPTRGARLLSHGPRAPPV